MNIKITGSGSYIPTEVVSNIDFAKHVFLNDDGTPFPHPNDVVAQKFLEITGIQERRYVKDDLLTSDIATIAAKIAIEDAKIDPETLDYIIMAHNFGNVKKGAIQSDMLPSLAARVKHDLRIKNPKCVAYDMLFGCPGWVESVIQAWAFIKAGMAKKCLVIGAETLSRVVDLHDRDSMIYSDGAGATIIEATDDDSGILAHESASFTYDEAHYLFFGNSFNTEHDPDVRYIKMYGRKIYEFALSEVPKAMAACLEKSGVDISQVKKVLIHQANEKMDEAIIQRFYRIYKQQTPEGIMPMSIHKLGNSSVATVPTLYDLLIKGNLENHSLSKGDIILFASVGAGMNVNAIVYKV
ncbi:3-oxoacyl-ACP synthase III family protein [Flavobacterium capsici]|uniref:Ketoacyl-ACP synthase III n=1 Tax=Flavobacterium capsici TaxID=3075618 RepID=A0AA96EX63_9FLAO|nr:MULTISPECIES: ketoacyl-ACP synthase III [unclassified Flavobacterium]WNM20094.1 ketoacyl-ACP synthase III [Flavobacterium sp. PMR2A8]WNM21483.1 ketoacyl-ACP synthase III [Flavobacterium sp. PMTSA4]